MRRAKISPCPKCGMPDKVVPILYGMPAGDAMEQAERGEIVFAGCLVGGPDPRLSCRLCLVQFDFESPELASHGTVRRGWIEESSDRRRGLPTGSAELQDHLLGLLRPIFPGPEISAALCNAEQALQRRLESKEEEDSVAQCIDDAVRLTAQELSGEREHTCPSPSASTTA